MLLAVVKRNDGLICIASSFFCFCFFTNYEPHTKRDREKVCWQLRSPVTGTSGLFLWKISARSAEMKFKKQHQNGET